MRGRFDVESIAAAFAEAAFDSTKWPTAMDHVAQATQSYGAVLLPVRGRLPNIPFSLSMGESVESYLKDGWVERDERYLATPIIAQRGVATESDFITTDAMARHPYYQDFLARFGLRWFAGVKVACGDDFWCCSIQRTIQQGPFSPDELDQLAKLSSRLSSSAALARAVGFARVEAALDAFEISGEAVVMLDRCGDVLRLNSLAEQLLGLDLHINRRRLVSFDRDATAALDRTLHVALCSETNGGLLAPIVLPRLEGRPILAYVSRPTGIAFDVMSPCQFVVVLVDLDARVEIAESELTQVFGLTPAEARFAGRFLRHESLEGAAKAQGITYESARNILKKILSKTGTHRQADLASLLAQFSKRGRG